VPPSNLNILLKVEEGTAQSELLLNSENIKWSYLSLSGWVELSRGEILTDTTDGFQTTGLVSLIIGKDATDKNPIMPVGMHWIRASVAENPGGAANLIELRTQAVDASRVMDEAAIVEFEGDVLPQETIKSLSPKNSSVKAVTQPYTSFGGKAAETSDNFYTRISERLRHKKRSVTFWDYERMVLEEFPEIFKVKCLNHTSKDFRTVPGAATVVVVSNLRSKNSVNPLEPSTSSVTLGRIKEYLSVYHSAFVELEVVNPVYERLLVDFSVGFVPGKDPGYYRNVLNEDIKKFLSPWAYEEGKDIIFGGKVYKSDILAFVENREYVDYVNDFKLYHIREEREISGIGEMSVGLDLIVREVRGGVGLMTIGESFIIGEEVEIAESTGPGTILVSSQVHNVTVLRPGEYECVGNPFEGIGYMTLDFDFLVHRER